MAGGPSIMSDLVLFSSTSSAFASFIQKDTTIKSRRFLTTAGELTGSVQALHSTDSFSCFLAIHSPILYEYMSLQRTRPPECTITYHLYYYCANTYLPPYRVSFHVRIADPIPHSALQFELDSWIQVHVQGPWPDSIRTSRDDHLHFTPHLSLRYPKPYDLHHKLRTLLLAATYVHVAQLHIIDHSTPPDKVR